MASTTGYDGVRSFGRRGDQIGADPEVFFDLGEQTLAFSVLRGRGRQSGADVAMPVAQVVRSRDGRVVYFKTYSERHDALRE